MTTQNKNMAVKTTPAVVIPLKKVESPLDKKIDEIRELNGMVEKRSKLIETKEKLSRFNFSNPDLEVELEISYNRE